MLIEQNFSTSFVAVLSLLLSCLPHCQSWFPAARQRNTRMMAQRHATSSTSSPNDDQRRRKRNKYASFSKVDKLEKDPLEALIAESEAKVLELELKTKKKRNEPYPIVQNDEPRTRILFPDTRSIDPYDPTTYGYTELGTIVGAHGVHGMLKIAAVTEFSERLCRPGVRHIKAPNRRSPRKISLLEGRHCLDDEYLVKLEGIGDRDAASKLRGFVLYAREEERPENLQQDEYLVSDLVGLEVFLEEGYDDKKVDNSDLGGKFVGRVGGIVLAEEMCAVPGLGQDMLEIVLSRGPGRTASWKDDMVLIPLVPQIVPRVDIDGGAIHITPPVGLLDLTYVREEKVRIKGFLPPAKD